jgi:hypothetical protein
MSLFGMTGSGKTLFAWAMLRNEQRLVVFDPKATLGEMAQTDWDLEPWTRKTEQALLSGKAVRLRVPPPAPDDPDQRGYWERYLARVYQARRCRVYFDEVYGVIPPGSKPGPYFSAIYTRGRELDIGAWASSQRPAWVPLFVRSEAEWLVSFHLTLMIDRQRLAEVMGEAVMTDPPDPYGFYLYRIGWPAPVYSPGLEIRGLKGSEKGAFPGGAGLRGYQA